MTRMMYPHVFVESYTKSKYSRHFSDTTGALISLRVPTIERFGPSIGIAIAIAHWPLAIGHWPLAIGHWPLAIGHWAMALALALNCTNRD